VRRATHEDLTLLVELARRYCETDQHVFDEATVRAGMAGLLDSDRHGVAWIIGDPEPVGYAVVTWGWSVEGGGPEALLDEIYVEQRGQGLGAAAVEWIIDDCRRRGMRRIFLETESHNEAARRLYARLGFTEEDSVWMSRLL
jgi:GNAT superfamily N-acetyltransferase